MQFDVKWMVFVSKGKLEILITLVFMNTLSFLPTVALSDQSILFSWDVPFLAG
jgi:hypothetical protein